MFQKPCPLPQTFLTLLSPPRLSSHFVGRRQMSALISFLVGMPCGITQTLKAVHLSCLPCQNQIPGWCKLIFERSLIFQSLIMSSPSAPTTVTTPLLDKSKIRSASHRFYFFCVLNTQPNLEGKTSFQ